MKKILLILTLVTCITISRGQQSLTLYNMDVIGQSIQVNPSMMPENGMYFGIPGLSSTSFLFTNSGFTWRDLHRVRQDDSVSLELEYAISQLADKNFISMSVRENILEAGFKIKNNYFSLNVTEKANFNLTFPKELFELLYKGNGAFIGQEVSLSSMSFDITHYREYGIGWTRALNKKTTVGGRLKYLYGMENISSAKSNLSFYTAPDDYQIELTSDYIINTSMSGNSSNNSESYIFGYKNTGFAADLSATYQYSERWKLNTSIVDLGYINWRSNVKNFVTASGSYTFAGIDINKFISDSSSSMESVTDSLSDSFKPVENTDSYKTWIPTHVYFNATYLLTAKMTATGLLHAQVFRESVQPTFTAQLNRRWNDYLSTSINYSMINHHFDNLGFGFVFHDGAFQFYVLSDNIIGTINPLSNHTAHVQFGFNLIYGRQKNKKPVDYGVQNKKKTDIKSAVEQEPQEEEDVEKNKDKEKEDK